MASGSSTGWRARVLPRSWAGSQGRQTLESRSSRPSSRSGSIVVTRTPATSSPRSEAAATASWGLHDRPASLCSIAPQGPASTDGISRHRPSCRSRCAAMCVLRTPLTGRDTIQHEIAGICSPSASCSGRADMTANRFFFAGRVWPARPAVPPAVTRLPAAGVSAAAQDSFCVTRKLTHGRTWLRDIELPRHAEVVWLAQWRY